MAATNYKSPGVRAKFVPAQTNVDSNGQTRVMALIGTGKTYFEKKNVAMYRNDNGVADKLPDSNIAEIYSITSQKITDTNNPDNITYTEYTLKEDNIIWQPLAGDENKASYAIASIFGDSSFRDSCVNIFIDDQYLVLDDVYKIEIVYVDESKGTYRITRQSDNTVLGEYAAGSNSCDAIPGVSLIITSTFVLDDLISDNRVSKTKEGDYILLQTIAAKCHIKPMINAMADICSLDDNFSLLVNNTNYNVVGDGQSNVDDILKWPLLSDNIKCKKNYTNLTYKIKIYENGIAANASSVFSKLYVGVDGVLNGKTITNNNRIKLYDVTDITTDANEYDLSALGISNLSAEDNLTLSFYYIIRNDNAMDGKKISLHLNVIDSSVADPNENLIAYAENLIFVNQDTISHQIDNQNNIFLSLIKNLKIINENNIELANYKIKISNLANNEITIYDITNEKKIGTYSTTNNASFKEAIPGVEFDLYAFNTQEGLSEMYTSKDIIDNTGSTIIISVVPGVLNKDIPADDSEYYVSYKYLKSESDYEPLFYNDFDAITAEYGQYTVTASGVILNSLTLGAQIAMENGADSLICVQAKSNSDVAICNAIDKLNKKIGSIDNINIVIPLTTSPTVRKYLKQNVDDLSSSETCMYRMGYLSASDDELIDKDPTIKDMTMGSIQAAKNINDERIVYVVPGQAIKTIIDSNTGFSSQKKLPGCYLAVAAGAIAVSNDPAEPLTNKTIQGFDSLCTFYTEPQMNLLASNGCLVIKQEGNVIKIRHGITTHGNTSTLADIQANEITLIQIKDYVITGCRKILGDTYIGGKLKPTIVSDIKYTLTQLFTRYVSQDIILGVEGLSVKRDVNDPRQVNVSFAIEAIYPLNYIDISFGFSTDFN